MSKSHACVLIMSCGIIPINIHNKLSLNISGKLGSAVFDPADTTNCLTCVKNYTFIDHGYTDCTGHCKKQLPEEVARRAALSMGTGALLSQASNADTNNEALQDSIRTK